MMSMNLAVDIGNTLVKFAVAERGQILDIFKTETPTVSFVEDIFREYPDIDAAIVACLKPEHRSPELEAIGRCLEGRVARYVELDHTTPVPVINKYKTPETLGLDRLAAAVGAAALYPGQDALVFDVGTAITVDFVSRNNEFVGGCISPGMHMRFKALNQYTRSLPLVADPGASGMLGDTTLSAIQCGVVNGIVYEIQGYIARFEKENSDIKIIFTGGDGNFFAERLKNTIFATSDLVLFGLNRILDYNNEI